MVTGARSKEADEQRRQIDAILRQKDANNERYQQNMMNMQKETEERHNKEMAEMRKMHQESLAEIKKSIPQQWKPKWCK